MCCSKRRSCGSRRRPKTDGSAILPKHIDFVTALVPSVLTFQPAGKPEEYLAVDHGILVKCGSDVTVSTRNAVRGINLEQLKARRREAVPRARGTGEEGPRIRGQAGDRPGAATYWRRKKMPEPDSHTQLSPSAERMIREVAVQAKAHGAGPRQMELEFHCHPRGSGLVCNCSNPDWRGDRASGSTITGPAAFPGR